MVSIRSITVATVACLVLASGNACVFEYSDPSEPWPSPSSPCMRVDLSTLPTGPFVMNDTFPEPYTITSPCNAIKDCNSPGVQNRAATPNCPIGIPLGEISMNSSTPFTDGAVHGMNLTLRGGANEPGCDQGRTLVYNFICDSTVSASNPPLSPITIGGDHCTYIVTWRTPSACAQPMAPGSCYIAPNVTLPTANQLRYQRGEIVALTHFNMASFVKNGDPGCTRDNWLVKASGAMGPSGDPATFNPVKLDTDQWASVYQKLGVKGAVLTAKHGCGHLLWPTKVTLPDGSPYSYGVGKSKSAIQTDVLKSFQQSMDKANITHGFYYSLTNNFFLNVNDHNAHHDPKVLPGQVDVNQTEYEAIALAHVTELWSNYGQLGEIWFDGGYGGDMATGIHKIIQQQKSAVGFGGEGVMSSPVDWIGTESGMPGVGHIWSTGNGHGNPDSTTWLPKCCDTTLQMGDVWFFEPGNPIRDLGTLINVYHQTVGRNGVLEMDFAINRDGLVDPVHEDAYTALGDWIRSCYGTPLIQTSGTGGSYTVDLGSAMSVDRTVLREDQSQGDRVRSYTIEAMVNGSWAPFTMGTGVGNRQIDIAAAPVMATKLRCNITSATAMPIISHFGVYKPCTQ